MGSEWIVLGLGVIAMGVAFFIRRSARKTLDQAQTVLREVNISTPPTTPPTPSPPKKPKSDKKRKSDFKGFKWSWPVGDYDPNGSGLPSLADERHLTQVFLQEIRDEARVHSKNQQLALLELSTELKEFNKLMRQLFGTEDP